MIIDSGLLLWANLYIFYELNNVLAYLTCNI